MAAEVNKPDLNFQWASGGAIVAPSDVKIQTGWTAEVPPFQWENYLQNRQDNGLLHLFQKGISVWSATDNYYFTTNGERSYVQGSDGSIYVAVQDSINQNPVTDGTDTYWKLAFASKDLATTALAGIVELATNAEMATGTSASLVPSVAAVMSLFSKRSWIAADYIRIPDVPGGLLIQFGTQNFSGAAQTTVTWPTPFPTAVLADVFLGGASGGNAAFVAGVSRTTTNRIISGAIYPGTTAVGAGTTFTWIAIGY